MRLTRTGGTLAGYYLNDNNEWTYVGSGPMSTGDFQVGLVVWPDYTGGGGVKVTFENPMISTEGYLPSGGIPSGGVGVPDAPMFIMNAAVLLPLIFQRIRRLKA